MLNHKIILLYFEYVMIEHKENNNLINLDHYFYLNTLKKIFLVDLDVSEISKNQIFSSYFKHDNEIDFNHKYLKLIQEFLEKNTLEIVFENYLDFNINIFCTQLINDSQELSCTDDELYFIFSKLIKFIFSKDENNSFETNPKIDDLTYENLHQLSNIIIYFISKTLINPIIGSILIAEIWPLVSYDQRLNQFIGREIEIFELQNQISNLKYIDDSNKIENIELKITNIKKKIIIEADIFIRTIL